MKHHTESTINACGRSYRIEVYDRSINPFEVQVDSATLPGDWQFCKSFSKRTEAIQYAADMAVRWINARMGR